MSELLGCPFCGGGSERVDGVPAWQILHTVDCFFRTRIVGYVLDGDVPKWNRRTPPIVGEDARDANLECARLYDKALCEITMMFAEEPVSAKIAERALDAAKLLPPVAADSSREKE